MPTDDASARAGRRRRGAGTEVARQQRHRVADRHHLAEQGLSQRRRRDRLGGQLRSAHRHRPRAVHRDRRDEHGGVLAQPGVGQRDVVEQRGARRGAVGCHPDDRGGGARTGQRHRVPLPNAQRGNGFRMQSDDSAAGVQGRGVQSRGQRELMPRRRAVGDVEPGHVRDPAVCAARGAPSTDGAAAAGRGADRPPRLALRLRFVVPHLGVLRQPAPRCGRRTGCGSRRPTMISRITM